jgi:hypothetical protein
MRTRRPTDTTLRGRLARRLLVALALALVMTIAAAETALASGHDSTERRSAPAAGQTRTPPAPEPAADESSSSPMIVLVFAGILILAVASPALPRYSRYGYRYYRGERW